ncbi:hypothetical protein KL918_004573 [Ogataea parapolymorpha]|uniref:E3 ubiquitin-protein ligase listerin n=1 Tax=Ogataea parapolymorpha (strain ATCC 26012 / BCRC 20466 / JCM 22074 / NRRL Y-7560 / DL-1) TaxID=871575 RepID=W1QL57_OGAPD|nr:hypothetical protein HPODL_00032 [Ogataea parapolymorpha DL-1]ESX03530.1 hypothetical protein HPODL_00032 [Ogataea parapolymorpha DL-1]KAG7865331.1 hypothetical protein KL918_004573 [Ogataea parapolymorpha]KAG7873776.1 hypothetical protein KL916_001936 [Ogataea parapolymorpha]
MSFRSFGSFGQSHGLGTNGYEVSLNYITGVPDPNLLSSANLKLVFKALLKRDDTTREKAIVDLYSIVDSNGAEFQDELVLISWCQLYAKLSTDNSKKVRLTAHQIQSKLVALLGKKYVKYLRDTVGIWMSGCFENDRVVSKGTIASISAAFGDSPEKTSNLWKIFAQQLLTYCHQLLLFETIDTLSDERFVGKEESQIKYLRTVHTGVQMLISLVTRQNSGEIQLDETLLSELLESDQFVSFFESKDLQIKGGMYTLLQRLLQTDLDDLLFKHLAKAAIRGLNLEKKNMALYSGIIIPILEAVVALLRKDSQTIVGIRKATQRILDLLRLGSLNSDPHYYSVVATLLPLLPQDDEIRSSLLEILENDVRSEKFAVFSQHAWICYLGYCQRIACGVDRVLKVLVPALDSRKLPANVISGMAGVANIAEDDGDVLLDLNSEILNALPGRAVEFVDLGLVVKNTAVLVDNYVRLLLHVGSDLLDELVSNAVESLTDLQDEYVPPSLAISVIETVVRTNCVQFRSQIESFVGDASKVVTPSFFEPVFALLVDIAKSQLNVDVYDAINDIAAKLSSDEMELFLKYIADIPGFDPARCDKVSTYIHQKADSVAPDADDYVFQFLTPDVLRNMFGKLSEADTAVFLQKCNRHYQNDVFLAFADEKFLAALWKRLGSAEADSLLDKLEQNLDDHRFEQLYISSLARGVVEADRTALLDRLAAKPQLASKVLPENVVDELAGLVENVDHRLAVSNKLGLGIYLFPAGELTAADRFAPFLEKIEFYFELASRTGLLTCELAFQLALVGEVAMDYVFLGLLDDENRALDFHSRVCAELNFGTDLFDQFVKDDFSGVLTHLQSSVAVRFYAARVLVTIFTKLFETMQSSTFNSYNLNRVSEPVKLAILATSANRFLTAPAFDRVRNQACADLLRIHGQTVTTNGLQGLVVLNMLIDLDLDYVGENVQLFPAQRFGMMLNGLATWPESEDAYEPSFVPVRIALCQFVEIYIKKIYHVCDTNYPSDFSEKVFALGATLCSESLSIVTSGDNDSTLAYFSLKLFGVLHEQQVDWDEEDVYADLVELLFAPASGQTGQLVLALLTRVFSDQVPTTAYKKRFDDLLLLLSSPNTQVQKLAVFLLHKVIPELQDVLVVEATLNQDEETKLPAPLLENIVLLPDENEVATNKYLWSWYLIFDHFKNITQKIRQDYILELGEDRMGQFLDFLFDMDLKPTEDNRRALVEYSVIDSDGDDLLYHLMYLVCKHIGGNIAQTWFQSIRNKQHKSQVETFIVKNVSPLLIDETLAGLEKKDSIKDPEFSIRLNRTTNEVRCVYEIDEQKLEMSIVLPKNYPLSAISVNGTARIGVDEKKWKSWILSCQYVINFQNGTILEAIQHFKNNVKANFDNYDDCAVCYSIVHVIDHSTPNKVCPTCKHNFHSACLYRWFKSSGSSTCPLCRSKFQFKKHS